MSRKSQRLGAGFQTVRFQPPPPPVSMELALNNDDAEDLLTKILLRLPVKSLIRFKSVCKKWLDLISSDDFCHQHTLLRPILQQSLILQMHNLQFFYFDQTNNGEHMVVMIPYNLNVPDHQIRQECNGLLLLEFEILKNIYYACNPTTKGLDRHPRNSYCIYNPTTKQSRKISLTSNDKYPCVAAVNLAFDPLISPYYKIVCIRSMEDSLAASDDDEGLVYQIEVYDSENDSWKLDVNTFTCSTISDGVHWNNSIYWRRTRDRYCRYDIGMNEMKTVSFPQSWYSLQGLDSDKYLQELNGHLYHFENLEHFEESVMVWELGGMNHSEWLPQQDTVINDHTRYTTCLLRLMGDGDGTSGLLTYEARTDEAASMKIYNFRDKSYEDLVDLTIEQSYEPEESTSSLMTAFQFGEVLAVV